MGTDHCRRLAEAIAYARRRPTRVLVLMGGRDFWSNGIHLNLIEAANDPAEESWRNINAMSAAAAESRSTSAVSVLPVSSPRNVATIVSCGPLKSFAVSCMLNAAIDARACSMRR